MTDETEMTSALRIEADRVRRHLGEMVAEMVAEGGDVRAFSAALLTAAVQLHAEVEGLDGLARAITALARRQMTGAGVAGSA